MSKIKIQENITLAPFTTFKIGGPARFFVAVTSEDELVEAIKYAQDNKLEIFILAGGSNILVSDEGFNGLVIKIQNSKFKIKNSSIECDAGLQLSEVVKLAKNNSLSGLAWAAGIPGTIGGAVRGNAGAYGSEIGDSIKNVRVMEILSEKNQNDKSKISNKFQIINLKSEDCKFAYRSSLFKENKNLIILSCTLDLRDGDKDAIEVEMKETIRKRTQKIPKDPSPGSFFKNPETDNEELIKQFEIDTGKKITDHVSAYQYVGNKIKIPAPWLIEEAGLKGKKIGGVMVSEKHANFVVNTGAGTAQDVIMLASFIKMKIRNKFGLQLKEEVQFVGF